MFFLSCEKQAQGSINFLVRVWTRFEGFLDKAKYTWTTENIHELLNIWKVGEGIVGLEFFKSMLCCGLLEILCLEFDVY